MALNSFQKISTLCSREILLNRKLLPDFCISKQVRHFRKSKLSKDGPKVDTESIATPFTNVVADSSSLRMGRLVKPFIFTVGFSGSCVLGAAIWEYENMRSHAVGMLRKPMKFFKQQPEWKTHTEDLTRQVMNWWKGLTEGEKVFVPICALNVLVFLSWRVPRFQPFMMKYFASNPASKNVCLPMLLSTFSQYSGLHLLANMYVLHSFSTGAVHSLGKEQFLALYLGAGVASSFTSYMYKIITKQPGLSLGASGAIMAILGYVCTQHPDTRLGIILLPMFTFSAGAAIKFIIGLDTAGVLFGWKFFDHAAHLGGAACGIFWALWGNQYIWQKREPILHYWHELRGSIK